MNPRLGSTVIQLESDVTVLGLVSIIDPAEELTRIELEVPVIQLTQSFAHLSKMKRPTPRKSKYSFLDSPGLQSSDMTNARLGSMSELVLDYAWQHNPGLRHLVCSCPSLTLSFQVEKQGLDPLDFPSEGLSKNLAPVQNSTRSETLTPPAAFNQATWARKTI